MFTPFNLNLCHFCGIFNPSWQTILKELKFKLNFLGTGWCSSAGSPSEKGNSWTCSVPAFSKSWVQGQSPVHPTESCPSHWPVSLPFRSWLSLTLEPGVCPGFLHSWIGLDLSCLTWRWTYSWNLSQESFISSPLQTTQSLSCSKSHWCRKFTSKNSLWCRDKLFPD